MNRAKIKGYLEVASSVGVLLVSIVILVNYAASFWNRTSTSQPIPQAKSGLSRGRELPKIARLNYADSPKTILIAMNTQCHFCKDSLPFYKKLVEAKQQTGSAVR